MQNSSIDIYKTNF